MAVFATLAAAIAAAALPPAVEADVQCLAVFTLYPASDAEEQAGIAGGMMFYIGRIEGRAPGLAYDARLRELIADDTFRRDRLPLEAQRCGQEMVEKGEQVERLGKAIEKGSQWGKPPR